MSNYVDARDLVRLSQNLAELENEVRNRVLYKAIIAGARKLQENAQMSLRSAMGASATRPIVNNKGGIMKTYKPLMTGIKMSADKHFIEAVVHIMGHGYLKWFEKGTDIRQTKSGANRGRIQGLNFFFSAKQQTMSQIDTIIETVINKEITRLSK